MDTDEHRLFNWPQTHTNHYFFMFQQKIGTEQIKHIKYFSYFVYDQGCYPQYLLAKFIDQIISLFLFPRSSQTIGFRLQCPLLQGRSEQPVSLSGERP